MKKIKLFLTAAVFIFLFTGVAGNCLDSPPGGASSLCNPTQSFASDFPTAALQVVKIFGVIISWTVIAYLMFAGFQMIMSQGNEEAVSKAKSTFKWTLAGFLLALFSYIIIYAVSDYIGVADIHSGVKSPASLNPLRSETFADLLKLMIQNFLGLAGTLALLLIIISGFRYITARGNEEQASQAKTGLQWAIIGLFVILLAYVIVIATAKLFGADVTTN